MIASWYRKRQSKNKSKPCWGGFHGKRTTALARNWGKRTKDGKGCIILSVSKEEQISQFFSYLPFSLHILVFFSSISFLYLVGSKRRQIYERISRGVAMRLLGPPRRQIPITVGHQGMLVACFRHERVILALARQAHPWPRYPGLATCPVLSLLPTLMLLFAAFSVVNLRW